MRVRGMAVAFVFAALVPRAASACGGCFAAPSAGSLVTDHWMVLSIGQDKSTLYDQIRYAGAPESFAWVLPVMGDVTVGLSAPALFEALDRFTAPLVATPGPACGEGLCEVKDDFSASPVGDNVVGGGVNQVSDEVVGPYEIVRLRAKDAGALDAWLDAHAYVVPTDARATVDAYIAGGFDFLAMKLVPGAGVGAMRPVRVTMSGAVATLPLRMIAAGSGAEVGVTLVVAGEGRYEPSDMPWFVVRDEELTWDWTTRSSSYAAVRSAHDASLGGGAWDVESSVSMDAATLARIVWSNAAAFMQDAGYETDGGTDGGADASSQRALAAEDVDALFGGATTPLRFTRLHATLPRASLARDLTLVASADQSAISAMRFPALTTGTPPCTCTPAGFDLARGCGCRTASSGRDAAGPVSAVALLLVLFVRWRRRSAGAILGSCVEGGPHWSRSRHPLRSRGAAERVTTVRRAPLRRTTPRRRSTPDSRT